MRNQFNTHRRCLKKVGRKVCGGLIKVTDSRSTANALRRRRVCTKCDNHYTTYEMSTEVMERLEESQAKIEAFIKAGRDFIEFLNA